MLKFCLHKCKRRCHRVLNHSQVECIVLIEKTCDRMHKRKVMCNKKSEVCRKCLDEDKAQERRIKRDLDLELERVRKQEAYNKELAQYQDEIDHQRRLMKNMTEAEAQKQALEQQKNQLKGLKETASRMSEAKKSQTTASTAKAPLQKPKEKPKPKDISMLPNGPEEEWEYEKEFEGARNNTLDQLMDMIGLDEVKQAFLEIKGKVDTKVRQQVALTSERFNCSLLGNPGTGKRPKWISDHQEHY